MTNYEIATQVFGWAATVTLMFSSMLKNKWLRIVNICACVFFIIYGIFLHSWQLIVSNVFCIVSHLVNLIKGEKKSVKTENSENLEKAE